MVGHLQTFWMSHIFSLSACIYGIRTHTRRPHAERQSNGRLCDSNELQRKHFMHYSHIAIHCYFRLSSSQCGIIMLNIHQSEQKTLFYMQQKYLMMKKHGVWGIRSIHGDCISILFHLSMKLLFEFYKSQFAKWPGALYRGKLDIQYIRWTEWPMFCNGRRLYWLNNTIQLIQHRHVDIPICVCVCIMSWGTRFTLFWTGHYVPWSGVNW